jgi:hypothetical protein
MTAHLLPIERVRNFSPQDFDAAILKDQPLILEGAIAGWDAVERWNPEYLAKKIGTLPIDVRTSSSHLHPDFDSMQVAWNRPAVLRLFEWLGRRSFGRKHAGARMTFGDFLTLLMTSPEGYRYLAGAEELAFLKAGEWAEAFASLRPDFEVPSYIPASKLDSSAMWVSARGVRSHLHYDGNCLHNLNAQVVGSKHVQLYSPAQMVDLYPYLYSAGHPYTFSQVNVEDVDQRKFPHFSGLVGYEGVLRMGDLLFIPAYWYHTFKHLGDFNANVNFWWRADFVRLTPVSARDHFGALAFDVLAESRIPPLWLAGFFRELERRLTGSR